MRPEAPDVLGDGLAARFSLLGMLEDQRRLQVTRAVKAGSETEMTLEEGSDAPETIKDGVCRSRTHRGRVYLLQIGRTEGRARP